MKTEIFKISAVTPDIFNQTAAAMKNGAIIVLPTETVYGISAAADNPAAVEKMCNIKQKPHNVPLQYLADGVESAKKFAVFSPAADALAQKFWPGGITLVLPPTEAGKTVARGFDTVGIRVPDNDFALRLLKIYNGVFATSSANIHGRPPANTEEEILAQFDGVVDYIFLGGTPHGTPSTVMQPEPFKIFRAGAVSETEILNILKNVTI
ncbi:MAG: L-threonylcarbamoyladenylate synthase [Elusimicrobia bacterium]|nr:L-threonylcarbamoyladenylate synthase [Elusimicrobiota bacterium]